MKSQALLLGSLFLIAVGFIARNQWLGFSVSPESIEKEGASEGQKSEEERLVIQGVAAYLEKNPDHLPNLQTPQEAQIQIRFLDINLSDSKDFSAGNADTLKNLVMKASRENPNEFLSSIKNQFSSLSSDRSQERVRLLEVAKISVAYLPPGSMTDILLTQAEKYNSLEGSEDFTFGAKALQAYFDVEPDLEKRKQALNRVNHM